MANKMIIDAAHPEETRVVVLRGNRVEEFDFEAASKKQLRGNIYLAKVTRVEPSLQAAFIEYGGNRHGFLAFAEIHPDYYQIPVADRQALLEEEANAEEEDEDEGRSNGHRRSRRHRRGGNGSAEKRSSNADETVSAPFDEDATATHDAPEAHDGEVEGEVVDGEPAVSETETQHFDAAAPGDPSGGETSPGEDAVSADARADVASEDGPAEVGATEVSEPSEAADDHLPGFSAGDEPETVTTLEHGMEAALDHDDGAAAPMSDAAGDTEEDRVEQLGGDALEDVPRRVSRPRRNYKIQEVIKRRQVLLVQVVKEERGNKGAALTTYLSLAGRYSVLMPNTARGGGISRKITDSDDRKRLKAIAQELEVPEGMGIILRTAGAARGMPEVKRDFEYLMRMWETVRETTLRSSAPTLVYEEGSLIKRSIRDLYGKEVDEVLVAGEQGYKEARDFMRLLMPSHTKNVIAYRDPQPIFAKSGVEAQLDAMFSNQVTLRSGGYLVINQTEALVAIDVNSGRSTREHNIEDTALRTNLEAADEIARQLRLRDLAGLIVVDFIDMEEGRNDRAVERRIKDALKDDRARIQIGRISHFGLLEMSRQRMRTGVLEGSTIMCPHCAGSGTVRSVSSIALHVLRLLEDALIKSAEFNLSLRTRADVAFYILNQKRSNLLDLEIRFGVGINVVSDPLMTGSVYHAIERGGEATPPQVLPYRLAGGKAEVAPALEDEIFDDDLAEGDQEAGDDLDLREPVSQGHDGQARGEQNGQRERAEGEGEGSRRRKRRRRRRGRDNAGQGLAEGQASDAGVDESGMNDDDPAGEESLTAEAADETAMIAANDATVALAGDAGSGTSLDNGEAPFLGDEAGMAGPVPAAGSPAAPELAASRDDDTVPAAASDAEAETPRRRRVRRSVRGSGAVAAEASNDGVSEAADAGVEASAPARRPRRSRSKTAEAGAETVDKAADGDTADAKQIPATDGQTGQPELPLQDEVTGSEPVRALSEPERAAAPAQDGVDAAVAAEPRAAAPEPDPDRPKRSGWWQRAKASFS